VNYYEIVLQGIETITLTYELEQHRPAQVWAKLINNHTPKDLRPKLNPWRNFDRSAIVPLVIELNDLIDQINLWLPEKIDSKWNTDDNQGSINKLHVHFPEHEKNETDPNRRSQLTRYNDIIHELEGMIGTTRLNPRLLICFDEIETIPLELEDFKHFTPGRKFGELCLHYPHVGRHPFELYRANDYDCPVDQIVPQSLISADHTCRFHTDPTPDNYFPPSFKIFYERSTLKHVIDYNDPRMAFGYITLGKLKGTYDEKDLLKRIGQCTKIISWRTY